MLWETLKIAFRSLGANKMRTMLSILGIIIGVGAVIAVISIAAGTQQQVTSRITDLGSNIISINHGIKRGNFGRLSSTSAEVFTLELGQAIVDYCPAVSRVVPTSQASGHLMAGENNYRVQLTGTTIDYQKINNYFPVLGKFFSQYDLNHATNVIILGSELVEELYENKNPLGSKIKFYYNNQSFVFRVIGVMEEKDGGLTSNLNASAYIPITTYLNTIGNSRYVSSFVAQAISSEQATQAVQEIEYLLNQYFAGDQEQFSLMSQDQLLDTINEVTGAMTLMLSGIAAISLLVGGIGIMNIMLVSVTERTREIGIRKALGAKRRQIQSQFLIEALTLSTMGGILGVITGSLAAYGVAQLGDWPLVISLPTVLLALGFSMLVGMFFGIYPAMKASKLDPVVSLSYE